MNTCFFIKTPLSKRAKKATIPKFDRFMPKTSKIALKHEKRTDIININPVVSRWRGKKESNSQ